MAASRLSYDDDRRASARRLPKVLYEYIDGGGFDEVTLRRNRHDLDSLTIRQKVLVDVGQVRGETRLFGQKAALPFALAPVGFAGMVRRRGEAQAARAAARQGVPFGLSTLSLCSVEEVIRAARVAPWLQLYLLKEDADTSSLLRQAAAMQVETVLVTVDVPVASVRRREARGSILPPRRFAARIERAWDGITHPAWMLDVFIRGRPHDFGNLPNGYEGVVVPTIERLQRVRDHWKGNLVIKGVLDVEDARLCAAIGADGIVVSNHGGRQLDSVRPAITALPPIARAVGGAMTVLMDSGIQSGLDLFKAVASGADACLAGRAWVHALAAGGEGGVDAMLERIGREFRTAMALSGKSSVSDIGADALDLG